MKIRYYGHAGQLTGYGRAAENMIMALDRAGADVEVRTLAPYETLKFEGASLPVASLLKRDHELDPLPDVVIVHTLPMDCPRVVDVALREGTLAAAPRPTWIAYTTWEATDVPFSMQPYEVFDDVWHPSPASARGWVEKLASDHKGTVAIMPHCFDESLLPFYRESVVARPSDGPYRFYSIGAFNVRKNIVGLIRAYAHEFSRADEVELVLSCHGMTEQMLTQAICSTGLRPDECPVIRAEFNPLTEDQLWAIHRGADCFVSASRGEGWNLPAFEAMLAGRHVIAPAGQGHDFFLLQTSARLYQALLAPAQVQTIATRDEKGTRIATIGAQGLTARSVWHEPDLLDLASKMRAAYENRDSTLTVNYDVAAKFGMEAVGRLAINRLNLITVQRNLTP